MFLVLEALNYTKNPEKMVKILVWCHLLAILANVLLFPSEITAMPLGLDRLNKALAICLKYQ